MMQYKRGLQLGIDFLPRSRSGRLVPDIAILAAVMRYIRLVLQRGESQQLPKTFSGQSTCLVEIYKGYMRKFTTIRKTDEGEEIDGHGAREE